MTYQSRELCAMMKIDSENLYQEKPKLYTYRGQRSIPGKGTGFVNTLIF